MAGWIKMPLGMEAGLSPGDCVRWGPSSPPQKGAEPSPTISAHVYCAQTARWITMALGMEVCLGRGHIVLDGTQLPLTKKAETAPNFRPMSVVAKRLYVSGCHSVRR